MNTVADACPLIFLSKIDQLGLLEVLFEESIVVLSTIKEEILTPFLPVDEEVRLRSFLAGCLTAEHQPEQTYSSLALSYADNCILSYAINNKAARILSDDKLVRKLASANGIVPLGTLGILLLASKRAILPVPQTRALIDELIHRHKFRIGIEVFEQVLKILERE